MAARHSLSRPGGLEIHMFHFGKSSLSLVTLALFSWRGRRRQSSLICWVQCLLRPARFGYCVGAAVEI